MTFLLSKMNNRKDQNRTRDWNLGKLSRGNDVRGRFHQRASQVLTQGLPGTNEPIAASGIFIQRSQVQTRELMLLGLELVVGPGREESPFGWGLCVLAIVDADLGDLLVVWKEDERKNFKRLTSTRLHYQLENAIQPWSLNALEPQWPNVQLHRAEAAMRLMPKATNRKSKWMVGSSLWFGKSALSRQLNVAILLAMILKYQQPLELELKWMCFNEQGFSR